jgi:hypothetical protein
MVSTLFYIRERDQLPAVARDAGRARRIRGDDLAMRQMLGYQNSRLRTFHAAKQVLAVIEPSGGPDHHLCLRAVGSTEAMSIEAWVAEFQDSPLCRLTIERVEEVGEPRRRRLWRGRG